MRTKNLPLMLTMALMALCSLALTSCSEDEEIAYTLEGTWKGDMFISTRWGDVYYDADYSELYFAKNPYKYAKGDGYWVDYYDSSTPWGSYHANHIRWEVRQGVISIHFVEDGGTIDIYDYRLNDNIFSGYVESGAGERLNFKLYHTSSPNWSSFDYYGWDDWGYGYAKPSFNASKDSVPQDGAKPVREVGRRK